MPESPSNDRKTRHFLEWSVDGIGLHVRVRCTDLAGCTETRDEDRTGDFCCIEDWWENVGDDLLTARKSDPRRVLGTVDLEVEWEGYGEDADLFLYPAPSGQQVPSV